ncbi:S49 family peptidase [Ottowia massiliensis]|jgi:peptidase S49|uniref:S49 family peptidase n=1 Tax=Ottowia massiliensis TaxID=2045302 RepID=UPI000C835B7A|nr:S49 family peptidase [Ottowia massiliensis]
MKTDTEILSRSPEWERRALEKLLLADARERRAARRWRVIKTLLWMLLVAGLAAVMISQSQNAAPAGLHTAVISIRGEISSDSENNAEQLLPALRSAMEDEGAQALVLQIDSPGGSPVQAGLVYDEIRRLRELHDKPVYAVVEDTCASAAYYIASAADKIYVNKASVVGSIGVLMDGFGFTGSLEKLGIERRLLTAGGNKGFLDPFSPMSDAQRQHAQTLLDQIHRQFIAAVKQGRGERLKETADTFSGLFWTGEQAVDMGLADSLGSVDGVAREVVKAEELVDYTPEEKVFERLTRRLGAAIGQGAVSALRSVALR